MFSFLNSARGESLECAYPVIKETLPRSKLGYNSNNQYPEFPPLMSDGRSIISSWQPDSVVNNQILTKNDIKSNWQYRKFIKENAEEIMKYNFRETCNDTGYYIQNQNPPKYGTPYMYDSIHEQANRTVGPETKSDLKDLYLSRNQLEMRKIAPSITQEQFMQMWASNKAPGLPN
jgi:hypothetical protein